MEFPKEFIDYTSALFGKDRWEHYINAFNEDTPVSIRLNPFKVSQPPKGELFDNNNPSKDAILPGIRKMPVPWCRNAYYLSERPNFTLDPLLHAGVYYVQEAGSMFLDEALRQLTTNHQPSTINQVLDLCAAPGGKSTLLRAALHDDCQLYSNEPDRRRANILMENIQKQGHPNVIVTNNYAIDYQRAGLSFDLILCDVPCSGEGMFRKDHAAINEWSLQNVMKCAALQRSIIEDIWPCLNQNGILVYSTCTFNLHEDEENVKWICETLGAELIPIETKAEWNITGSLLDNWNEPVYRFIPGTTKGEGLFMAVLRKTSTTQPLKAKGSLRIMSDGHPVGTQKGKNIIPAHAESLLINLEKDKYPQADVDKDTALKYLHHEAIVLGPDTPKGIVLVSYKGHPLGFAKNIGNRANNLYPQEWKIRNL